MKLSNAREKSVPSSSRLYNLPMRLHDTVIPSPSLREPNPKPYAMQIIYGSLTVISFILLNSINFNVEDWKAGLTLLSSIAFFALLVVEKLKMMKHKSRMRDIEYKKKQRELEHDEKK